MVKERLGIQPTPELWCLFGDLVDDPQHYVTSWEISGCKYARAKRSLAFYYIRKQKVYSNVNFFLPQHRFAYVYIIILLVGRGFGTFWSGTGNKPSIYE